MDVDVDLHAALLHALTFLPEPWRTIATALVQLIAAVIAAFTIFAAVVKPFLGTPSEKDPLWKRAAFWFVQHVVDRAAGNTQKVADKRKQAAHAGEVAKKDRLLGSKLSIIESQERELQSNDATIQRQAELIAKSVPIVEDP